MCWTRIYVLGVFFKNSRSGLQYLPPVIVWNRNICIKLNQHCKKNYYLLAENKRREINGRNDWKSGGNDTTILQQFSRCVAGHTDHGQSLILSAHNNARNEELLMKQPLTSTCWRKYQRTNSEFSEEDFGQNRREAGGRSGSPDWCSITRLRRARNPCLMTAGPGPLHEIVWEDRLESGPQWKPWLSVFTFDFVYYLILFFKLFFIFPLHRNVWSFGRWGRQATKRSTVKTLAFCFYCSICFNIYSGWFILYYLI